MPSAPSRPTLYLVDGTNIEFRAFLSISEMKNQQGLPTNALFGFVNMLLKLIRTEQPDYLAIAWDPKGGSFRDKEYPDYKGTRPDMPEPLRAQMPYFERIAQAFCVPYVCVPGYEADDVMGTLARQYQDECDVVLVSSDKDLMQLVGQHVSMLDTMKDRRISFDEVNKKFGCRPELVPDALGIWGDSSDNIPGVKGIGEKGVKKLLEQYDGLDDIYAHLDEIKPPGMQKKLRAGRDNAYLSKKLATIVTNVDLDVTLPQLAVKYPPPEQDVRELALELDFRSLLRAFGGAMTAVSRDGYRLCLTEQDLAELTEQLTAAERFAFDTETTSLDPRTARLVGLSFCCDQREAWYLPVGHDYLGAPKQLNWTTVRQALRPLFEDSSKGKTGQNLKFDLEVLEQQGLNVQGIDGDTLIADYLLSPDRRTHKLDDLALAHLEHKMIAFKDAVPKGETFAVVELEKARDYAAEDAHIAWLLDEKLTTRLAAVGLEQLYRDLEIPLVPVLVQMEQRGIAVDVAELREFSVELTGRIAALEQRCYELAGQQFTINSVPQLRTILFEQLQLPVVKKTKTGPSTDERVLTQLASHHELPGAILDYRGLVKLKNTYVDPLPDLVNPKTGRIHSSFSQTTAATGRLASNNPNMQNIPVRTEEGRRIRHAFRAPPGRVLLSCDYSQIELRVLAHLCGGQGGFAEAFAAGIDVHAQTAASVFDVAIDEVSKQQRRIAKAVNFGIVYGQTAHGLAQTTRISRPQAAEYLQRYNERFPEIAAYKASTLEFAKKHGYVETLLGRRRPVAGINAKNFTERSAAERVALNTPVQGTAADMIKKAMITVHRRLGDELSGQWLVLQVHDELLLEVDEDAVDQVQSMVVQEMSSAMQLSVPVVVDTGVAQRWDEAS